MRRKLVPAATEASFAGGDSKPSPVQRNPDDKEVLKVETFQRGDEEPLSTRRIFEAFFLFRVDYHGSNTVTPSCAGGASRPFMIVSLVDLPFFALLYPRTSGTEHQTQSKSRICKRVKRSTLL
jgi:hypothetical protein